LWLAGTPKQAPATHQVFPFQYYANAHLELLLTARMQQADFFDAFIKRTDSSVQHNLE
jgi:hypothetical protein